MKKSHSKYLLLSTKTGFVIQKTSIPELDGKYFKVFDTFWDAWSVLQKIQQGKVHPGVRLSSR